jgi:hypothetical protein
MGSFSGKYSDEDQAPSGFEPFPAGIYELELVEGEVKPTAAGTGEIFKHKIKVIAGEFEGRLIFGNMNLTNPNAQAETIGRGEFKALREVVDVISPDEPEELCFRRFTGVVKIKPAAKGYDASNAVDWGKTYKLFKGELTPEKAVGTVAANDNKPSTSATPKKPWAARKAA